MKRVFLVVGCLFVARMTPLLAHHSFLAEYDPDKQVTITGVRFDCHANAHHGLYLQGADFPSGLVGVMQGIILFCALGGELLIRYRN